MREPKFSTGQNVTFVQFDEEKKEFVNLKGTVADYRLGYQDFSYDITGEDGKDYFSVPECAIRA